MACGADDAAPGPDGAMIDVGTDAATARDAEQAELDVSATEDASDASDGGGSAVRPMNLVVTSNGREIGWLQSASLYSLNIWDPASDLIFNVNDVTGNVTGNPAGIGNYDGPGCSEKVYLFFAPPEGTPACEELTTARGVVYGEGGDPYGLTEATAVVATQTTAAPWSSPYRIDEDGCAPVPEPAAETYRSYCHWPLAPTTAIPTSFELPIEVHERSP